MTIDTLIQHINNIFSVLPQTKEVCSLKQEVLNELISLHKILITEGYNTHQATSLLLDRYRNIDDIFKIKDIPSDLFITSIHTITLNELIDYISLVKYSAGQFCIGLSLILFAFPCFYLTKILLLPSLTLDSNLACIPALFILLILISVGLFIILFSHSRLLNSSISTHQQCMLSKQSKIYLEKDYATYPIVFSTIIAILLCLISPLPLLTLSSYNLFFRCCHFFSFCILLSCACSIFIMCNTLSYTYTRLIAYDLKYPLYKIN